MRVLVLAALLGLTPLFIVVAVILITNRIKAGCFFPNRKRPPLAVGDVVTTYGWDNRQGKIIKLKEDPPGDGDVVVRWDDGHVGEHDAGTIVRCEDYK